MIGLVIVSMASYAEIYKWTDSQGNVHFSDKAHEGAEKIKIPDAPSYSSPSSNPAMEEPKSQLQDNADASHEYKKIAISQPENEATIRNNQGYVAVAVQIEPDLIEGDELQLLFDGAPIGEPQKGLLFQINGIYRGSHRIAVQVQDEDGNVLLTSEPITIYMHRPRINMGKGAP